MDHAGTGNAGPTWSETTVEGPRELSTKALPQPPSRLDYYRDAAVIAFPRRQATSCYRSHNWSMLMASRCRRVPPRCRQNSISCFHNRWSWGRLSFVSHAPPALSTPNCLRLRSRTVNLVPPPGFVLIFAVLFRRTSARRRLHHCVRTDSGWHSPAGRSSERVVIEQMELHSGYRVPDWTSKAGFATDRVDPRPATPAPLPADRNRRSTNRGPHR